MMKHPLFLLILIFSPLFVCCNKSSENLSAFEAMDTFMSVKTFGKNSSKAASLAKAEIFRKPDSAACFKERIYGTGKSGLVEE